MRTLQQILDAVIDADLYCGSRVDSWWFMCWALVAASRAQVITEEECATAQAAIREYLQETPRTGTVALEGFLIEQGFDLRLYGTPDRHPNCWDFTKLYRDWANRPMPEAPALADHQAFNPE